VRQVDRSDTHAPPDTGRARLCRARGVVLAAALAVGLMMVTAHRGANLAGAVLFAVAAVAAYGLREPAVVRLLAFAGASGTVAVVSALAGWSGPVTTTLLLVLPVLVALGLHRAVGLRPVVPWLVRDRMSPSVLWLFAATTVLSVLALIVWTLVSDPRLSDYLSGLQQLPWWAAVAGIVGFALVNAAWEEALFRGYLLTELDLLWGARAAVAIEAIAFGVSHSNGYPSGPVGVVMAVAWGAALGAIRIRSGGIILAYAAHVTANSAIGVLAYLLL